MNKKILIAAGVVVAVAAGFATWTFSRYTPPYEVVKGSAPAGLIVSIDSKKVVIRFPDIGERSFKLTPETSVLSQLSSGEVGVGLEALSPGALVAVLPAADGSAAEVQIIPPPPFDPGNAPKTLATGRITTISETELSLVTEEGESKTFGVDEDTVVLSIVTKGERAKAYNELQAGDLVLVDGASPLKVIQLLLYPLP